MKKEEFEQFVIDTKIKDGISSGMRIRCYGVWSIAATAVAGISSWIASHFEPVRIGFAAFWVALWKN